MRLWLVKEIELFEQPFVFLVIILSQPAKSLTSSCNSEQKYMITNIILRSASVSGSIHEGNSKESYL